MRNQTRRVPKVETKILQSPAVKGYNKDDRREAAEKW